MMKKRLLFFLVIMLLFTFQITFTSAQELLQENVIGFTGQRYDASVGVIPQSKEGSCREILLVMSTVLIFMSMLEGILWELLIV
jgi:hypothetical protein